jgi:hypothetical protein
MTTLEWKETYRNQIALASPTSPNETLQLTAENLATFIQNHKWGEMKERQITKHVIKCIADYKKRGITMGEKKVRRKVEVMWDEQYAKHLEKKKKWVEDREQTRAFYGAKGIEKLADKVPEEEVRKIVEETWDHGWAKTQQEKDEEEKAKMK